MDSFLVILYLVFIYFLPWVVAKEYKSVNSPAIFILNLFLGWTLIGWVIALVWAFMKPQPVWNKR